jgi:phosphoribosylformylglycinamidine cyclo-ligase
MASLPDGLLHAAAHITGGGLIDNLPRVLPKGCQANIRRDAWKVPPIFRIIEAGGRVDPTEMYQVFNMGIGMTLIVSKKRSTEALRLTRGKAIGEIVEGSGGVVLV